MGWTHDQIVGRLEAIEADFADRQEPGERYAADYHRAKRDFEELWAKTYMRKTGQPTARKQATVEEVASSQEYKDLVVAEAAYEGWRAAMRALEGRSMIGMALLKASTREGPQTGTQPAWSRGRAA